MVQAYKIAYNANGGTGSMADTEMTVGANGNLTANSFTRTGYTFLGWSKDKNASAAAYTNGQSVKDLAQSGTVTLYAVWKKNASSSTNTAAIRIDNASALVEQTFQIPVYINNANLSALTYIIEYDSRVLELTDTSNNLFSYEEINSDNKASGKIIISSMDSSKTVTGKFTDLCFNVIAKSECTTKIKITATTAADGNLKDVSLEGSEAAISIETGVMLGDIDGNGKVNVVDALLALKASTGKLQLTESQQKAADADKNGKVNVVDALMILKASTGKINLQ